MSAVRDVRSQQLLLTIKRIKAGRGKEKKLTFAAVAREANVSTALIHNCYPEIAERIREEQGRSTLTRADEQRGELQAVLRRNSALREQIRELESHVRCLASRNEVLHMEIEHLKSNNATLRLIPAVIS